MEPIEAVSATSINNRLFAKFGVKFITDGIQFGDDVNGSYKTVKVGTKLITYRMESSVWVVKDATIP